MNYRSQVVCEPAKQMLADWMLTERMRVDRMLTDRMLTDWMLTDWMLTERMRVDRMRLELKGAQPVWRDLVASQPKAVQYSMTAPLRVARPRGVFWRRGLVADQPARATRRAGRAPTWETSVGTFSCFQSNHLSYVSSWCESTGFPVVSPAVFDWVHSQEERKEIRWTSWNSHSVAWTPRRW
jgi:hypothetical protein